MRKCHLEEANVIWKKMRRGELTSEEASDAAAFADNFEVETVALKDLVLPAVDLSIRLDHAVYDCFYLALSMLQECPCVTADRKLHDKVHANLGRTHAERCVLLASFA